MEVNRKGQITLIDLILAPLVAVILSVIAVMILQGSTFHLINEVNMEPTVEACNFGLETLFSSYYVHTASSLQYLQSAHPNQYAVATTEPLQIQTVSCGYNCSVSYEDIPNTLGTSSDFYVDFIQYFDPFALSVFNVSVGEDAPEMQAFGMQVFLNRVPALPYTPSEVCSLTVFNPQDPGNPYTIYGVMR